MEKKQAQDYIKEVLNSRFDQEQFELFVRNLLNEFEPKEFSHSGQLIPEAFRDHISHFKRLGVYTDPEAEKMDILIVQTESVSKLERTRTALRNFVVRHLKKREKFYALVAFYSKEDDGTEWRLSLVKIDVETERTNQNKIKAKEIASPAKRFSYLVGEYENAHTAQKQLLPLLVNDHSNPLIIKEKDGDGSVEGAFSIEKVTDEFYEQYKELYLKLTESAALTKTLKKKGLDPVRFVKKLLGQIVFLYFLQKKGWLGVPKDQKMGEGPKNFLRKKFDEINKAEGDYFNDFLRYLFYEALAKEHHDEGIKYYNKRLGCKIPFLNGGLFEADYENWDTLDLDIDNSLFSNPNEKTKGGDKGTGILDVFDRYNFTIREDEPLEKEVAVDPEMLGKVFENLLEVTDRKSKGAFYTPREIVYYMCQESLIHYLDNTVNQYTESYQSIDSDQTSLFGGSTDKKGNLKIELENKGDILIKKDNIEQYIRESTIALEKDEDYFETQERIKRGEIKSTDKKPHLDKSIYRNAERLDRALANIKICDPAIGSGAFPVGLLHEIVSARKVLRKHLSKSYLDEIDIEDTTDLTDYYFKRHAIQESIYGVDIDASAIDVARLRLWLSMIVDEEDYETIETLPNLDYKIVCGNSLIGLPENAMRDLNLEKELEGLKEQFFHETDERNKKALRQMINRKIRQLLDSAESFAGYKIDFDFKLFFSEVWHDKDGFDVVIGNPPYDVYEGRKKDEIPTLKKIPIYSKAKSGKLNAYKLFLAKSIELQKSGTGLCVEIFQNSFLADKSAKYLRKYFLNNQRILSIDSFPERDDIEKRVFKSAKMSVCILVSRNEKKENYYFPLKVWKERWMENSFQCLFANTEILNYDKETFAIPSISGDERIVLNLISGKDRLIKFGKCYQGEINLSTNKSIITSTNSEGTKPLLKGAGIQKWHFPEKMSQGEIEYLLYEQYVNTNSGLKSQHFKSARIVMQGITGVDEKHRIKATILKTGTFCGHSVNYFSLDGKRNEEAKYYLSILNSSVSNWFFKKFSTNSNVNSYEVHNLPAPRYEDSYYPIPMIADYLLSSYALLQIITRTFFSELSDALIFEIMFSESIISANKQILPHLGDLKPITNDMSEEEKLAIIQSEFERLYDPNHPVRNNLETLDSVEEVRIIKEALK